MSHDRTHQLAEFLSGTIMAAAVISVLADYESSSGHIVLKTLATLVVFASAHAFGRWVASLSTEGASTAISELAGPATAFVAACVPPLLPLCAAAAGVVEDNAAAWISYFVSLAMIAACAGWVVRERGLKGASAAGLVALCFVAGLLLVTLKEIVH